MIAKTSRDILLLLMKPLAQFEEYSKKIEVGTVIESASQCCSIQVRLLLSTALNVEVVS